MSKYNVYKLHRKYFTCTGQSEVIMDTEENTWPDLSWTIGTWTELRILPRQEAVVKLPAPMVEFMYFVFTRMPGESYRCLLYTSDAADER